MTGFGQAEATTPSGVYRVELRSVNGRYLEMQLRQPRSFSNLEQKIRKTISDNVSRGSLSVFITCDNDEGKGSLTWDRSAVETYLRIFGEIKDQFGLEGSISLDHLLQFSDFVKAETTAQDDDTTWKLFEPVLKTAIEDFNQSREAEASHTIAELQRILKEIDDRLGQVEERAPQRLVRYEQELRKRIGQLVQEAAIDEQRMATEIAIMADRLDISEECCRLHSHIGKFFEIFGRDEPVGKRMNFLLQEMNREANTIGAKANDTEISHIVVELKENIEKIREQVQNIE